MRNLRGTFAPRNSSPLLLALSKQCTALMPPPADFLARLEAAEMRDNIDGESAAGGAAAAMPVGAGAVPAEERPMSAEATAAPPVNRLQTRDSLTEPSGPGLEAPPRDARRGRRRSPGRTTR